MYEQFYGPYENQTLYECTISILQPQSRGTIKLGSNDPYDPPLIDPNYMADPRDVEDVVEGNVEIYCLRKLNIYGSFFKFPFLL